MNKSIEKMYVMNKKILLSSASVMVFSVSTYADADGDFNRRYDSDILVRTHTRTVMEKSGEENKIDLTTEVLSQDPNRQKLAAEVIVDFAKFSYAVNQSGWEQSGIANKLINEGWKLDPFKGTTGRANSQVESESGLLAFKGDQVVIATRGTEMTNWADWTTNIRFSRSPFTRFFASEENNKLSAITAQFFDGVEGEVANGFLQTHLSSWDYIKKTIIDYAHSIGKTPQELQYTITGHSKGAAKAQLNALNLLTDTDLAVGINYMERSFIFSGEEVSDLGASGFYGVSKKSEPKNLGNVEAIVFESPRVFSANGAAQVNAIFGEDNLVRVENKGWLDDPVIHVAPEVLGFKHAGTAVEIDGGGTFVTKHMMGNVEKAAIPAIETHRGNVAAAALSKEKSVVALVKEETSSVSFGTTVVSAITTGASTLISGVGSFGKRTLGYFWG